LFRRRGAAHDEAAHGTVTVADVFLPDTAEATDVTDGGADGGATGTGPATDAGPDTDTDTDTDTDIGPDAGTGTGTVKLVDPNAEAAPSGAPDPITAPVPVVPGDASALTPPGATDRPVMRFGFGDHADVDARSAASVVALSGPVPDLAGDHGVVDAGAAGTGSVATKSRKLVSIGFDTDLEDLEVTPLDPSPVDIARPEVEPRMRARRIQVRRDAGRKRLHWVIAGGVVLALLIGAGIVLDSPIFAVNDVEVTGATYTNRARLQSVVDDLDGATLLGAKLGRAEQTLAADPWVKRVRIERRPLRGIRIEIVERTPSVTYAGADQHWRVLDPTGKVLAVLDPAGAKPVDPLTLLTAPAAPNLRAGATAPAAYTAAADLVPRLPPALRTLTCSMAVGTDGKLSLNLCNHYVIVLGSAEQLRDKLVTAMYLLTAEQAKLAGSKAMNVSDPFQPVLIPK
jgi:cell division protein FtsQ